MSNPVPELGQIAGRGERIKQYTEWSGAKLVDKDGSTISEKVGDVVTHDQSVANTEAAAIRSMLQSNPKLIVESNNGYKNVVDMIKEQLTQDELARVRFTYFDVPQPGKTIRV